MQRVADIVVVPGGGDEPRCEIPADIERALVGLALAVNHTLTREQLRIYGYALRDLDPSMLRRACADFAGMAHFFPKPIELREAVDRLEAERAADAHTCALLPLPAGAFTDPNYVFCTDCRDEISGFRLFWCVGGGELAEHERPAPERELPVYYCGRKLRHGPHRYAERCHCVLTNPVIAQKQERLRRRVVDRNARQTPVKPVQASPGRVRTARED